MGVVVSVVVSKSRCSGYAIWCRASNNMLGCIKSGPGDLLTLMWSSFSRISFSLVQNSDISQDMKLFSHVKLSVGGSCVKTLEK